MTKKELTPSEYEEMTSTSNANPSIDTNYVKYGVIVIVTLVLCCVSFGAGMSYQKGNQPTAPAATNADDNGLSPAQAQGGRPSGDTGGFGNGQ